MYIVQHMYPLRNINGHSLSLEQYVLAGGTLVTVSKRKGFLRGPLFSPRGFRGSIRASQSGGGGFSGFQPDSEELHYRRSYGCTNMEQIGLQNEKLLKNG